MASDFKKKESHTITAMPNLQKAKDAFDIETGL